MLYGTVTSYRVLCATSLKVSSWDHLYRVEHIFYLDCVTSEGPFCSSYPLHNSTCMPPLALLWFRVVQQKSQELRLDRQRCRQPKEVLRGLRRRGQDQENVRSASPVNVVYLPRTKVLPPLSLCHSQVEIMPILPCGHVFSLRVVIVRHQDNTQFITITQSLARPPCVPLYWQFHAKQRHRLVAGGLFARHE